jgi:hypothetical protein
MSRDILDLHSDYLLVSTRESDRIIGIGGRDNQHDQIILFLAGEELYGKPLWLKIKKLIRQFRKGLKPLLMLRTVN